VSEVARTSREVDAERFALRLPDCKAAVTPPA